MTIIGSGRFSVLIGCFVVALQHKSVEGYKLISFEMNFIVSYHNLCSLALSFTRNTHFKAHVKTFCLQQPEYSEPCLYFTAILGVGCQAKLLIFVFKIIRLLFYAIAKLMNLLEASDRSLKLKPGREGFIVLIF